MEEILSFFFQLSAKVRNFSSFDIFLSLDFNYFLINLPRMMPD